MRMSMSVCMCMSMCICVYVYMYVWCVYVIITKIDELDKHIHILLRLLEDTYKHATVDLQVYRRTKYIFGISSFGMNKIYFEKEQSEKTQLWHFLVNMLG